MKNQQGIVWTPVLIMIGVVVVTGVVAYIMFNTNKASESENTNVAVVNQTHNNANGNLNTDVATNTSTISNANARTSANVNWANDVIAGWEAYVNTSSGFSFSYPSDWFFGGNCYGKDVDIQTCDDVSVNHEERFSGQGSCLNEYQRFSVKVFNRTEDLEEYAETVYQLNEQYGYTTSQMTTVTIDGLVGERFTLTGGFRSLVGTEPGYLRLCQEHTTLLFQRDDKIYVIQFVTGLDEFDQILSTFQFTD